MLRITYATCRQTIDTQFFVTSKIIAQELKVPILPWDYLVAAVRDGETDLDSEHARKMREWVWKIVERNQLLFAGTTYSGEGNRRITPYVSSPGTCDGNVFDSAESMLRVDHANNTEIFAIAANMQPYFAPFFASSNIENEVRNIIPSLMRHSTKTCDLEFLFHMAPVFNVKFFLGLFFTAAQIKQLPCGLFNEVQGDKPTVGNFFRAEKVPEGAQPFTAYGVHIAVICVVASFMGADMPLSPECPSFLAAKAVKLLMENAPASMLHPSGTHITTRGFTGKAVHACVLHVPAPANKVNFFLRQQNDTAFMNSVPEMSMLSSRCRPYMPEDMVHVQWLAFLTDSHPALMQLWNKKCAVVGTRVEDRKISINSTLNNIGLSDLYRTLDPSMLPPDDSLVYGVHYPILGTGLRHTTENSKWETVLGWVVMYDDKRSRIHIFHTDQDECMEEVGHGGENVHVLQGDPGCAEESFDVKTPLIFATLRSKRMLVLPLIARPAAVLYYARKQCYGVLHYNTLTGQCYDPATGGYTLRMPGDSQPSVDSCQYGGFTERFIDPLEAERCLLSVPTKLFVDTRAFIDTDGILDQRLPVGAGTRTYLGGILWYPHSITDYEPDKVYLLVRQGADTSSNYTLCKVDVEFLVHPDAMEHDWRTIHGIRCGDNAR
jgi:hypothetical protein